MTIDELASARLKLQADIADQVSSLLSAFKSSTGVGISELEILTTDVTALSSNTKEIVVSGAIVRLDI